MENACKFKYECEKFHEQGDVILPLLDVWRLGFDCKSFLDVLASLWNAFEALKPALCMKTVSHFLSKKCKFCSLGFCAACVCYALGFNCVHVYE